jgi:hypothetical protein
MTTERELIRNWVGYDDSSTGLAMLVALEIMTRCAQGTAQPLLEEIARFWGTLALCQAVYWGRS